MKAKTEVEYRDILAEKARQADKRLSKKFGYETHDIQTYLETLFKFGTVEVGYRCGCGYTDPTMYTQREWDKIIKLILKYNFNVKSESVKHLNGEATWARGWWDSFIYTYEGDRIGE
jgi:hypothetical protein